MHFAGDGGFPPLCGTAPYAALVLDPDSDHGLAAERLVETALSQTRPPRDVSIPVPMFRCYVGPGSLRQRQEHLSKDLLLNCMCIILPPFPPF